MTTTHHPRATVFLGRVAGRLQRCAARLFQGAGRARSTAVPEVALPFPSAPAGARPQPMTPADPSPTEFIPTVPPVRPYVLDRNHLLGRQSRRQRDRRRVGTAPLARGHRPQPAVGAAS